MATVDTPAQRVVIRTSWGFFANSILAAAMAVVLARIIEQLGVAVTGAVLGRDPVLARVATELGAPGSEAVFLGGTAASILVGTAFLLIYPGAKDRSAGKLMVLWLILFCFRNGFWDLATLPFSPDSDLSRALSTFDLPAGLDLVLAAAGGVGLLLVSVAAAPAFLGFARHRSEVATPQERLRYVATIAVLPAVVGPLLAVTFFVPDAGTGYVAQLPMLGAFTLATLLAAPGTRHVVIPQLTDEPGLSWGLVATLAVVFVALRLAIGPGIPIPPWGESLEWRFRA